MRRRTLVAGITVAILAASTLLIASPGAAQPPPFEPLALWEGSALARDTPIEAFDAYGVTLAALETDRPLLVGMNDNSRAYIVDPLEGVVLAEVTTPHAGGSDAWWTRTLNGVAVGDVDNDGRSDLIVLNTGGYVTRLERDPGLDEEGTLGLRTEWSAFAYAPAHDATFWQRHPWLVPSDPANATHLAHGHPFLAVPDGAQEAWVYVQSDDLPGAFAFGPDGSLRWMDDWHDGHAGPWVGRLAPDGPTLALFATDAGQVVARDAGTGREVWVFEVPEHVQPGGFQVAPNVADIDGDGTMEILVAARVAEEGGDGWMERQHAWIALLDADGTLRWSTQHPTGNPLVHGAALAHDIDGDGVRDWVLLDWNTIGRKPGNFERLGPGNLFAIDGDDGSLLWSSPVDAPSTDHDFAVASFGGRLAALVPHTRGDLHGIATIDMATGAHIGWNRLPEGWTPTRGVVLEDLDLDGSLEAILFLARPGTGCIPKADVACREGAIAVFRTDAPAPSLVASGAFQRAAPSAAVDATEPLSSTDGLDGAAGAPDEVPDAQAPRPDAIPWPGIAIALVCAGALLLLLRLPRQDP